MWNWKDVIGVDLEMEKDVGAVMNKHIELPCCHLCLPEVGKQANTHTFFSLFILWSSSNQVTVPRALDLTKVIMNSS